MGALQKAIDMLEAGNDVRFGTWQPKEVLYLNTLNLLSAKPVVYLVNMGMKAFKEGKSAGKKITSWVEENTPGEPIIHYSAKYEAGLMKLDDEKKAKLEKVRARNDLHLFIIFFVVGFSFSYSLPPHREALEALFQGLSGQDTVL